MAKMIKFPLDMGEGKRVRTIEELREAFNAEKLIGYFASGKLQTWLLDRHYRTEYEQIMKLEIDNENILQELCAVFQIEQDLANIEVTEVLKKEQLVKELRQFTDDEEILNHLDSVATNQIQLDDLLKQSNSAIYLLGEKFEIPDNLKNIRIQGINTPILKVKTDEVINFKSAGVVIMNCNFDEVYNALMEQKKIEEENIHKKKRRNYQVSKVFDYKLNVAARKESEQLFNKIQDELVDFEFDIDAGSKRIYKILQEADIWNLFDIDRYGGRIKEKIKEADLDQLRDDFFRRIS